MLNFLKRLTTRTQTAGTRQPQVHHEPKVTFVCEQDGEPERILKSTLALLLSRRPGIKRAYLARVDYGNPAAYEVALCVSGSEDKILVQEVASTFAAQFGRQSHLDVLFLTHTSEVDLEKVCRPFSEAG
jgi:hypothetical protein